MIRIRSQIKWAWGTVLLSMVLVSTPVSGQTAPGSTPPGKKLSQVLKKWKAANTPSPEIKPFLGMWMASEIEQSSPEADPVPVQRYLLIIWSKGSPRFKTYDYFPELGARSRESDWKGRIQVDRWNTTTRAFKLKPDGTLSVSFSGTNGVGAATETNYWWAYGKVELVEQAGKPFLHMVTTRGYAPSSKGNAWRPIDRLYTLVSRRVSTNLHPGHP